MIKDRTGKIIAKDSASGGTLDFLYKNAFGRFITKLLTRKFISELGRIYMDSPLSKPRIKRLIKENAIDMAQYEQREFRSLRRASRGSAPQDLRRLLKKAGENFK